MKSTQTTPYLQALSKLQDMQQQFQTKPFQATGLATDKTQI
jgi:hypothetical protein